MTIEEYVVEQGNWSIYHSTQDPQLYEDANEQFDKYLYTNYEFFKHDDYDNRNLYISTIICIYRYYYPKDNEFYWTVHISKNTPGLNNERFTYEHSFAMNKELNAEYIIELRKLFNV